ncbi:clavesin-1-like [Cryptotermes secundus]|uniref:clavesin-1-like n=1 Tax=Cryptotermes secundus TaxID=105785 RepID=UPI000CD7C0CE|nr:clavesin-1-like [Cryptotermes secundus]
MAQITVKEELSKDTKLKTEDIENLRDWLSRQPHLPSGITDEQLILFLHCCQYHLEDCKQVIETYYTIRTHSPELFAARDPKGDGVQQSLSLVFLLSNLKRVSFGSTDEQLILFLHCCQYHLEDCKQVIETYYTIRTHSPELFAARDPKGDGVQQSLSVIVKFYRQFAIMPKRDQHGNAVMIACAADFNPDKFHYNDALKTWFMLQDVFLLENGTVPGFVILVDSKGFGFGHLRKMNIQTVKKYCMYTQDALPGSVIGTHFLNSNAITDAMLAMLRPFTRSDTFRKVCLSMATYHKVTVELLKRYRDWFKEEEAFRVDESKRLGNPKNAGDVFGMEGSFKKLDID